MSDFSTHDNDRTLERHAVNGDVDVYDSLRDIYVGRLVNIHAHGMMIIGDVLLEEDKLYDVDMHLTNLTGTNLTLRVGVDCLWSRAADQSGKHWTGFSLIDVSPQAADEIRRLIALWSNN